MTESATIARVLRRVLFATVGMAVYVVLAHAYLRNPPGAAALGASLAIFGMGVFVYSKNRAAPLHQSFLVLSVFFSLYLSVVYVLHLATDTGIDRVTDLVRVLRTGNLLIPPALVLFTARFLQKTSRVWDALVLVSLACMVPFLILNTVNQYVISYRIVGWTYVPQEYQQLYRLCGVWTLFWTAFCAGAVVCAAIRAKRERRGGHYVLFLVGWSFAMVPSLLGFVPALRVDWYPSFLGVSASFFPILLGLSIVRYELFDIKHVIRRTLPYAVGMGAIGCAYGGILQLLRHGAVSSGFLPDNANWVFLFILFGVLFQPLLEGTRGLLDTIFFRKEAAIDAFIAGAGNRYLGAGNLSILCRMVRADVEAVLQVEGCFIALGNTQFVCGDGPDAEALCALFEDRTVGNAGWCEWDASRPAEGGIFTPQEQKGLLAWKGAHALVGGGTNRHALIVCREKKSHLPFASRDRMFLRAMATHLDASLAHLFAKTKAEDAETLSAALLDTMAPGVAVLDQAGRIMSANAPFRAMFDSASDGVPPQELAAAMASPSAEMALCGRHYLVTNRVFATSAGTRQRLVTCTDITELHALRATALQQSVLAQLGATISTINHEIMNILSPIETSIERVRRSIADDGGVRAFAIVEERLRMLGTLTREMREYYRPPAITLRRVNIQTVLASAIAHVEATNAGPVWCPPVCDTQAVFIQGDPQKLAQVFLNLLKNAWEAMDGNGSVDWGIRLRPAEGVLLLEVYDNGPGFQEPERLFEPFYSTKKVKGTGLGLAISRRIITAHHGAIHARRENNHTVFSITLPLSAE